MALLERRFCLGISNIATKEDNKWTENLYAVTLTCGSPLKLLAVFAGFVNEFTANKVAWRLRTHLKMLQRIEVNVDGILWLWKHVLEITDETVKSFVALVMVRYGAAMRRLCNQSTVSGEDIINSKMADDMPVRKFKRVESCIMED